MAGVYGGIVLGDVPGGLLARHHGILAPSWVGLVSTGACLAPLGRSSNLIVHADEEAMSMG